tara:strand:+ start:1634 stop:3433 length:1800 start_codon:yes stop_codon:yes gene_type:complete
MGITKVNKNLIGDSALDSNKIADGSIGADEILDNTIINADVSPQASIAFSKLSLPGSSSDLLNGAGGFQAANVAQTDTNTFNIGLLGFKMAVAEGLTIFNLKDGVVDEFNDESGIDTAENSNVSYDDSSDFYSGGSGFNNSTPPTENIFSFTANGPHTYTVESGVTNVNVLVVGGGGGGGSGGYNAVKGGGAGAGGLIYYPNYPVTPGGSVAVVVGVGGEGGGYTPPGPVSYPYTPTARPDGRNGTGEVGGYEHPQYSYPMGHTYYSPGQTGTDSSFGPLIGEGGGAGGGYLTSGSHPYMGGVSGETYHEGGSGGGGGGGSPPYMGPGGEGKQDENHPIPLTPQILPVNSIGSFGNDGGVNQPDAGGELSTAGGGGAGSVGGDGEGPIGGEGGNGLLYNIADGTTSVGYAGGGAGAGVGEFPEGTSVPFGGGDTNPTNLTQPNWFPGLPGAVNSGGGGAGARNINPSSPAGGAYGGDGGPGVVIVKEIQGTISDTSTTLVSDTFTASSTPTKARIVVFAEINSTLNSQLSASATRDNTTFNAITLTDTGYVSGSSGTKIFTGSTPLTGTASPQVQVRWKIVGSGLSHINTIHGVSLQWA